MNLQNTSLPRTTPEAQGIPSDALLDFVGEVEKNAFDLHSLMLLRHGNVVAEGWWQPYAHNRPHMLFSLSKSFTSTAAGLAIAEGRLSLDDTVLSFFPDEAPVQVSENLVAMRVRHLLSMSTGHAEESLAHLIRQQERNWVKGFLEKPVEFAPGTKFVYNSGATYMVSAIMQRLTGMPILEYLQPRLFGPLGIENPTWESCPRGINTGGWGLSAKTEEIARFGQLYLQHGMWNGVRLLPDGWVEQATESHISNGDDPENDWCQGYGFQFWRCRHGAYRGDGAFGQFCMVMPDQDAVLAITAGLGDMQSVLNLFWKHLFPAIGPSSLPEDPAAHNHLRHRLENLTLRGPQGRPTSPLESILSGKEFRFERNAQTFTSLSLDFQPEECVLHIINDQGEHRIECGRDGVWKEGMTNFAPTEIAVASAGQVAEQPIAATGAWTDENTYVVRFSLYQTPFCPTLTFRFEEDSLLFDYRPNVSFGPLERPQLVGKLVL